MLSQAFVRAWMRRVDHVEFIQKACHCGENLMKYGQYDIALSEIFNRLTDRMMELKADLTNGKQARFSKPAVVAACARFLLGRCLALYQSTIRRETMAKRPDTIESMRDVFRDIMAAVSLVNDQEAQIREELYWVLYNASLTAFRVSRWLRLHGFGRVSPPALSWLAQASNKSLPLLAVHMLPFRMRFFLELVY
eukprot:TRINITY_DN22853_c0_g1_i1.p1 TRINITY_DN22853_c0_g1~~TRINITY_DN22853_c0_g1_i1.p1  ORF type:complete len:194 (-),score=20.78 TRINITY_DN22853_c0_g1_i1:11-592(-)